MTASIAALSPTTPAPAATGSSGGMSLADMDFTFHDFLSIINPLQHLPIVSTLYRSVTGDTINPLERVAGDTLYGGVWGFVSSVANLAFQEITGKDFGDTALALLEGGGDDKANVADAAPAQTTPATANAAADPATAAGATVLSATASLAPASIAATPIAMTPLVNTPVIAASVAPSSVTNAVAANGPPAPLQAKQNQVPTAASAAAAALVASMNRKGIDPALSQRALSAYQKSLVLAPSTAPASGVPTS